jgi:hypothetical protein
MHTLAVITDEAENRLINALIGLVVALTWWLRAQPKFRTARRRALRCRALRRRALRRIRDRPRGAPVLCAHGTP